MPDSPIAHAMVKPATHIDFVNPLLWVLFTNLAFSLGPSILQASDAADYTQDIILGLGMFLFLFNKALEVAFVVDLLRRPTSMSGRTVTTTTLLGAHVGLFAPIFISNFTLFARCTFMLWSVTLGAFLGILLGISNKNGDRDLRGD
ncbi:hypothetical protein V1522DRAFT_438624 [Lipomyces starkeyi]